jgi:hypothetical protein
MLLVGRECGHAFTAALVAISSMLGHAEWSIERGAPALGENTP